MLRRVRVLSVAFTALLAAGPASAFEVELDRYWQALARVCETGVSADLIRLHQEAVSAIDAAAVGGGRASNFWNPRTPEHAYLDCVQAPGWE